jgi:GH15 family glucan-1,4-alpha-glucosidase
LDDAAGEGRRLSLLASMNRIADYALIGDCHSAALVGRDGSIDWACFPCFDSPAVFSSILDEGRGGSWSMDARESTHSTRAYVPNTNVLVTTFSTPTGVLELTDCMPVERTDPGKPRGVEAHAAIMRRACGIPSFSRGKASGIDHLRDGPD